MNLLSSFCFVCVVFLFIFLAPSKVFLCVFFIFHNEDKYYNHILAVNENESLKSKQQIELHYTS